MWVLYNTHSVTFHCFLIIIGINSAFIYFYWYVKKSNTGVLNINAGTETAIYETYEWEV